MREIQEYMIEKPGIKSSIAGKSFAELILDHVNALIYISKLESFEILYMNDQAKQLYGDGVGKICWQWLQKEQNSPCAFCAVNFIDSDVNRDQIYIRDRYNPLNDKWYEVHDCIIDWENGIKAKLQIAYNIDHRKKDERKLRVLHKQQELFAKIAITFNMEKPFSFKLNEVLELVGNFVDVCRVSLFQNLPDKEFPYLTYEWCKKGVEPKLNHLKELVFDTNLPSYERLSNKEYFNIENLNEPKHNELFTVFKKFGVVALLFIPLFLRENLIGYLGFEVCSKVRIWRKEEIKILKTVANIISTALERKGIEENRLRSETSLRKANATKDKFFSVITRDLLAPYSSLISLSRMLLENYPKWDHKKRLLFVNSINESSQQGFNLLENLITWSKLQSGLVGYYPTDIDLRSAINLAIEQLIQGADYKNIKIKGIPEEIIFVYADYHMVHCIVKNLLDNAIKFTPENGEVMITVKKSANFVEVSVIDNGIGIEKAYMSSLFKIDRFSAETGAAEEKGTGLGLIISREFVEKNGGKIWAESKLGHGSCFTFTIPLSK
jgi:signal transduction histidine kinase